MNKKQVALIVLDGWGHREDSTDNAVHAAKTPFFDYLWEKYPHNLLDASGLAVGVPEGQIGNSEVGHTTIGAGTIINSNFVRINKAIQDESFLENEALQRLFDFVNKNNSVLHTLGIIGKGGVHGHIGHLSAFLRSAKKSGVKEVAIHAFTDGRDTGPHDSIEHMRELQEIIDEIGIGYVASVSGRYFAMDRDKNWDRLEKVENIIFECKDNICQLAPEVEIKRQHREGIEDEHIRPFMIRKVPIKDGDGVFFFNFRADRAKGLAERVMNKSNFEMLYFVTMTDYGIKLKCDIAFPTPNIETSLATEVSKAGMKQSHIAETEKFPHATYFLNGGREEPHDGEEHVMLQSNKHVKTHDEAPEMKAREIADSAVDAIKNKKVEFTFINFANPDMVGHTANVPAIITALETVDTELKKVIEALDEVGGNAVIIADHGNAEVNIDQETGEKHTAHTLSKVPVIITNLKKEDFRLKDNRGLSDVAPTVLELLELEKPKFMTGESLIKVL